jgi:hypothetical protein
VAAVAPPASVRLCEVAVIPGAAKQPEALRRFAERGLGHAHPELEFVVETGTADQLATLKGHIDRKVCVRVLCVWRRGLAVGRGRAGLELLMWACTSALTK